MFSVDVVHWAMFVLQAYSVVFAAECTLKFHYDKRFNILNNNYSWKRDTYENQIPIWLFIKLSRLYKKTVYFLCLYQSLGIPMLSHIICMENTDQCNETITCIWYLKRVCEDILLVMVHINMATGNLFSYTLSRNQISV